jgi:hypothetical protein
LNTPAAIAALTLIFAALVSGPSQAAEDAALRKDLTSTLMLLGVPCGQVVRASTTAEKDHLAVCANGLHYRVFLTAQGRVVAQRQ